MHNVDEIDRLERYYLLYLHSYIGKIIPTNIIKEMNRVNLESVLKILEKL